MMGDEDEKNRSVGCLVDGCLKEDVIEVWRGKGLMVGREEEKRGAAKADRAQAEVAMRGIDASGAAICLLGCCGDGDWVEAMSC